MTVVCVVGAGPRGTSVLERLCANSRALGTRLEVHVVDPYPPGAGAVWRSDQSAGLLMNTVAAQVSLFTDASVPCAGPVEEGPSLYEWAGGALGPDDYPTRAQCGRYLEWVFQHILATAPAEVTVQVHRATAVALADEPGGRQSVTLHDGRRLRGLDAVVLAQGHTDVVPTAGQRQLTRHARTHGLGYLPPANPADADLSGIQPGEVVAVRGLGLNCCDYLALLTQGRGGRFESTAGGLKYHPSGAEPVLYAGSRRGLPYHARGENQKGAFGRHQPLFLTEEVIAGLRRRGGLSFGTDIWPLLDAEVRAVYHHALLSTKDGEWRAADFLAEFTATRDPELPARYGIEPGERWDWNRLARPYHGRWFTGRADFELWLLDHLRADVTQARLGNVAGPLKAALDVLRDLRNEIRLLVDHGGLTGESYQRELAEWFTPFNAYLSIGPPASRIEEMIALAEAGVLRFTGPGMRVRPAGHGFLVDATTIPEPPVTATTLIEARVPDVDLRRTRDPLLRKLIATGGAQPYRIPDPAAGPVPCGGLAVTTRPYRVVGSDGRPHPRRFAYGVPTEGVHWATAAGVRPGVGSVILADSDAIARAVLTPVRAPQRAQSR
ncbi:MULTISPECIES: FAD/NAD(P)-binding protein [unclassified Crossiella]|uniref:FAD/NAD(P)-binding protein n=1 Tax=unclassified Crossiella TaxID=2620835 RepID=UPI001FFFA883|nr:MULTISPECIES: FAD/NAD(P)-binding protein [unclassified Crossiella]MCK2244837.1 FAD/NAD(P)-binding protein [Crossiella sp. S99.2]MCK2258479.1 FAD/NAD(P)-binding protein [Crossiella sp. S99.1]